VPGLVDPHRIHRDVQLRVQLGEPQIALDFTEQAGRLGSGRCQQLTEQLLLQIRGLEIQERGAGARSSELAPGLDGGQ